MASPRLFEPITLRGTEMRNRLWISPMCQYQATDGIANDWHLVHYGALARGGAGLVMVEASGVVPEGRISPGCLGLWSDEHTKALREVVNVVHRWGGKIGIQLAHAGRKASLYPMLPGLPEGSIPIEDGGWETIAPSAVAFTGLREPKKLTLEGIEELIEQFVVAADRAVEAGFDVVEVHGAHGYIISSFLSPLSNFREDEYGGSLENRAKLLRKIVKRIRDNHPDLPLVVRISASEWRDDGFTPKDGAQLAKMLKEDGADLIDVSSAANVAEARIKAGPGYQTSFASEVRKGGLPVGAVGMIISATQAETILVSGLADVVSIGREALRNHSTPLSWAKELRSDSYHEYVPDSYFRAWPQR